MRKDLAKVTTEASRSGSSMPSQKWGGRVRIHPDPEHDYEDEIGGFRAWSRHRNHNHKEFSDVLNPLKGAIRKNLGRPWDDVYSEFCALLDRRGVSGYHIWGHLMQEVSTKTFMDDGRVMAYSRYGGEAYEVGGYYVHPETGLLCWREEGWRYRNSAYHRRRQSGYRRLEDFSGVVCVQADGGWSFNKKADEYFELIEVGHRPRSRSKVWFHFLATNYEGGNWRVLSDYLVARGFHHGKKWLIDSNGNTMVYEDAVSTKLEKRSATSKEVAWLKSVLREAAENSALQD